MAQKNNKLKVGQNAPDFTIVDVNGNEVKLSNFKGKKVFITLYRNVGCPVCNLRFHEIESINDSLTSKNVVILSVYESSVGNMKKYLEGESFKSIMIPNPDMSIYKSYGSEKSTSKFLKSLFQGAASKGSKGKKLFKSKIKQDGNSNRIGAEFLIDENGKIIISHYHKFVGDNLSTKFILDAVK